jgi:hypothetical protein
MAKYGKKASKKVEKAMHERKEGTLKSGRSGKKVTSKKQAIAIGLSEARKEGGKVPRRSSPLRSLQRRNPRRRRNSRDRVEGVPDSAERVVGTTGINVFSAGISIILLNL